MYSCPSAPNPTTMGLVQFTDSQKIVITTITISLAEEALAEEVISKA